MFKPWTYLSCFLFLLILLLCFLLNTQICVKTMCLLVSLVAKVASRKQDKQSVAPEIRESLIMNG